MKCSVEINANVSYYTQGEFLIFYFEKPNLKFGPLIKIDKPFGKPLLAAFYPRYWKYAFL
jgi:hypothetical protein